MEKEEEEEKEGVSCFSECTTHRTLLALIFPRHYFSLALSVFHHSVCPVVVAAAAAHFRSLCERMCTMYFVCCTMCISPAD